MPSPKFRILLERNFWILLYSRSVSSIGEWVLLFSLLAWANKRTGESFLGGTLLGAKLITTFLSELIAGVYTDRFNRKTIVIVSDLIRAVLIGLFVFLDMSSSVFLVFSMLLIFTFVGSFYSASSLAIVPNSIKKEFLLSANTFFTVSLVSTLAIGPPLTAILLSFLNIDRVLMLVILMFASSGLIVAPLKVFGNENKSPKKGLFRGMKEGLVHLVKSPKLKGILPATIPISLGVGPILVLVPAMLEKEIHLSSANSTKTYLLLGLGIVLGFLFMELFGHNMKTGNLISIGLFLSGGSVIFFSTAENIWSAVIPITIAGMGIITTYAAITTMLQTIVPNELLGRVTMAVFGIGSLVGGISSILFGFLSLILGLRFALGIAGGLIFLGGLLIRKFYVNRV